MLIEFRTQNHKSIKDEIALTLEAESIDEDDSRARKIEGSNKKLLTVAGIYGKNASGKSNVIDALETMCFLVLNSFRLLEPGGNIPREPFAWGEDINKPTLFEVTILMEGQKYRYGFAYDNEQIQEEWLYHLNDGKKQKEVFLRDGQDIKTSKTFFSDTSIINNIKTQTRSNALFLSTAVSYNEPYLTIIYNWFTKTKFMTGKSFRLLLRGGESMTILPRLEFKQFSNSILNIPREWTSKQSNLAKELLITADLGISDIRLKQINYSKDNENASDKMGGYFKVELQHAGRDDAWLGLAQESEGTQNLFKLLPYIFNVVSGENQLIVIDEIESSLHPMIVQKVVDIFNSSTTNKKHVQLIFTTHDTSLMRNEHYPILRRDQIWLTDKDDQGGTTICPLTDYDVRNVTNIERGYLQGRYGAVPHVGNLGLEAATNE